MRAMILAAGKGERMRPLTLTTPKPLLKVHGTPLISYHIQALYAAKIRHVVVNVSYLKEQIINYLGDGSRFGLKIEFSVEEQPLDIAGGVTRALAKLGTEPFILISSDIWTNYNFINLVNYKLVHQAHVVLVENPSHNLKGDFALINGLVSLEYPKSFLNYSGIGLFSPDFFKSVTTLKAAISPLFKNAIQDRQISGEYYAGRWINVGTVEQLNAINQTVAGY